MIRRRRLLAAAAASRRPRHRRARKRPVGVRLEAGQGQQDRGDLPNRRARRAPGAPEGVRGADRHQGRLRADPRAAAAPQGGDGVGHRPSELRRGERRHCTCRSGWSRRPNGWRTCAVHRRPGADRRRTSTSPISAAPASQAATAADGRCNASRSTRTCSSCTTTRKLFEEKGVAVRRRRWTR